MHTQAHTHACMHAHTHTHTYTHTNTHCKHKGKGELWSTMKEHLMGVNQKEWTESVSLTLQGRAFHSEGVMYPKSGWPYHFVLQSLGPGTARDDSLTNQRERDGMLWGMNWTEGERGAFGRMSWERRRSIWQNELREKEEHMAEWA